MIVELSLKAFLGSLIFVLHHYFFLLSFFIFFPNLFLLMQGVQDA